jgi:hypothetical protein
MYEEVRGQVRRGSEKRNTRRKRGKDEMDARLNAL